MIYHESFTEENTPKGYIYGDGFSDFVNDLSYNVDGTVTKLSNGAEINWSRSQQYHNMAYSYHNDIEINSFSTKAYNSKSALHDDWKRKSSGAITSIGNIGDPLGISDVFSEIISHNKNLSTPLTLLSVIKGKIKISNGIKNEIDIPKGFKLTKEFGRSHGEKIYKMGNKYYSRDVDSHNGGVWKVFKK